MKIEIGLNGLNDTVLKELSEIQTTKFKIEAKGKKESLMAEPEILQAFIMGLSTSAAWDMLKTLFSILRTYNIKMVSKNTEYDKIGSIYFGGPVTIINQGKNSVFISCKNNSKKLIINENFEIVEIDEDDSSFR